MNIVGARHPNPFPGLRPFRSDEHHLFFGREEQVDDLIRRSPAVLTRFFHTLNLPTPAAERARDPVRFEWMIDKWAKHTNAPKKGVQNMTTKWRVTRSRTAVITEIS